MLIGSNLIPSRRPQSPLRLCAGCDGIPRDKPLTHVYWPGPGAVCSRAEQLEKPKNTREGQTGDCKTIGKTKKTKKTKDLSQIHQGPPSST